MALSAGTTITIPPGGVVQFTQFGYCLDAGLPPPGKGEKMRLIPVSQLLPPELVPVYKGLRRVALQDTLVNANLQLLAWGLREAGTKGTHAAVLTGTTYLAMLARATPGGDQVFLRFHKQGLARERLTDMANNLAKINVGGRQYGVADLASADKASALTKQTMADILRRPVTEPIPGDDSDYSMPIQGLAAHVVGAGPLTPTISLVNTTAAPITFDLAEFAAESRRKVQRVALAVPDKISATTGKPGDSGIGDMAEQFIKDLAAFMREKVIEGMKDNRISALIQSKLLAKAAPKVGQTLLKNAPGIGNLIQLNSAIMGEDLFTGDKIGCVGQALAVIGTIPGAQTFSKVAAGNVPAAVKALAKGAVVEKIVSAVEQTRLERDVLNWLSSDTAGMLYTKAAPNNQLAQQFTDTLTGGCTGGVASAMG